MRRQTPLAHQLYAFLYPHPSPNDPPNFSAHLARNLVPEVRIEVATFYGDLNSAEARYPGLNYCHPSHRMRLGRFKHHRRLFHAFDQLGLTYNEIQDFCCWEGTRWARERYEKDEGVRVLDTTGDEIGPFVDRRGLRDAAVAADERRRKSITRQTEISVIVEEAGTAMTTGQEVPSQHDNHQQQQQHLQQNELQDSEMSDADSPFPAEHEPTPLRTQIDQHLRPSQTAAASSIPQQHNNTSTRRPSPTESARRRREEMLNRHIIAAWEQGYSLPPELEQWLKEQSERGTLANGDSSSLRQVGANGASANGISVGGDASAAGRRDSMHSSSRGASTTTAFARRSGPAATALRAGGAAGAAQQTQQQAGMTPRAAA